MKHAIAITGRAAFVIAQPPRRCLATRSTSTSSLTPLSNQALLDCVCVWLLDLFPNERDAPGGRLMADLKSEIAQSAPFSSAEEEAILN